MQRKSHWKFAAGALAGAGAAALFAPGAWSDVTVAGNQGPSTASTPYLVPTAAGVRLVSILTVGESVSPKLDGSAAYRMIGLPDGLGALDRGDGTFTLFANHEAGSTAGTLRAHGAIGSTVSAWTIDRRTLRVVSGGDLIRNTFGWDFANQKWAASTLAFSRFCSADLAAPEAFFDPVTGKGTRERLFLNGEEASNGRAVAHVVTGPNTGVSYELPRMGRDAWENVVACPAAQEKTLVIGTDDTTPGQVFVYVGTKQTTGNEVQRAGLANGKLYGVLANAVRTEDRTTNVGIAAKGGTAPFTLLDLGDHSAAGIVTETVADTAGVTEFLRPEDGAFDPSNPRDFYFVTTDRFDQTKNGTGAQVGRSRLWRLRFTDLANPEQGGAIALLLDGTEAHNVFDNLCVDRTGHVLLQEDPGNVSWQARIWRYDIAGGTLTEVARHDAARFGSESASATAPFNQDEEASGIIDAADILGPGWFLFADQSHATTGDTETIEHGQILALFDPACVGAPTFTAAATAAPSPCLAGAPVTFRAAADVPSDGELTYAWTFGDGASGAGAETTHAYTAAGAFQATCTVTHGPTGATATSSVVVSVLRPISAPSLTVTLDFAKPERSVLTLRGTIPVASGFDPEGQSVTVDVGGITRTFGLDAKGRGDAVDGKFVLTVRKVKGSVPAQRAAFTLTLKGAALGAGLADDGLGNSDAAGAPVSIPVSIAAGGPGADFVLDLIYDAKAGRRGVAK